MTYRPKHPTLIIAKAAVVAGAPKGGHRQRARLVAYGYLRGKGYRQIEATCYQGGMPEYERNDLHAPTWAATAARDLAASYVHTWLDGRNGPAYDRHVNTDRDASVAARLKAWASGPSEGNAVVRCPDLPSVGRNGVDRVGTPAPASGSSESTPGSCDSLLAQVREWIGD